MRDVTRELDKTFLSIDKAEERGLIHRDYIAHCFRWSHVMRWMNQQKRYQIACVLDVGCGKEMPLARSLYVNRMTPAKYVGVDLNRFEMPLAFPPQIMAYCETDVRDIGAELAGFNVVVCLEMLEHVTPKICREVLEHLWNITTDDVTLFLSTPCWNGDAAENHINEMTYAAFGCLLERVGYEIEAVFGTFASISDYKAWVEDEYPGLLEKLREYYDTNVLSNILAPLYPQCSRNCLWRCRKPTPGVSRAHYYPIPSTQWSQHEDWRDLQLHANTPHDVNTTR